jgi:hypothetical protein
LAARDRDGKELTGEDDENRSHDLGTNREETRDRNKETKKVTVVWRWELNTPPPG